MALTFLPLFRGFISFFLAASLAFSSPLSYAQGIFAATLPEPGAMVGASAAFTPVLVKGLVVHPDQPFNFDFIVDSGNDSSDQPFIKEQSQRMAKYFLAAITVPEDQLWVNLSPYEKDRVIEHELGQTVLGRDMLAQDYILKQFTASLIYPEKGLGKAFWTRIYKEAQEKFGTTDIPVDTFNKVWITPEKAEVFEKGNVVYVTEARLKVMLDSDYEAAQENRLPTGEHSAPLPNELRGSVSPSTLPSELALNLKAPQGATPMPYQELAQNLIREIILPAIEKEVNEGWNFAAIRQIYHAAILAKWYRGLIQHTLLADGYVGQNKVAGVTSDEKALKERIYQRYIAAYKKGVFNYIREESPVASGEVFSRKYFSGGVVKFGNIQLDQARDSRGVVNLGRVFKVDFAMNSLQYPGLMDVHDTYLAMAMNVYEPPGKMVIAGLVVAGIMAGLYVLKNYSLPGNIAKARNADVDAILWLLRNKSLAAKRFMRSSLEKDELDENAVKEALRKTEGFEILREIAGIQKRCRNSYLSVLMKLPQVELMEVLNYLLENGSPFLVARAAFYISKLDPWPLDNLSLVEKRINYRQVRSMQGKSLDYILSHFTLLPVWISLFQRFSEIPGIKLSLTAENQKKFVHLKRIEQSLVRQIKLYSPGLSRLKLRLLLANFFAQALEIYESGHEVKVVFTKAERSVATAEVRTFKSASWRIEAGEKRILSGIMFSSEPFALSANVPDAAMLNTLLQWVSNWGWWQRRQVAAGALLKARIKSRVPDPYVKKVLLDNLDVLMNVFLDNFARKVITLREFGPAGRTNAYGHRTIVQMYIIPLGNKTLEEAGLIDEQKPYDPNDRYLHWKMSESIQYVLIKKLNAVRLENFLWRLTKDNVMEHVAALKDPEAMRQNKMTDQAMNGGVEMHGINLAQRAGAGRIQFNAPMVRHVFREGFSGFTPVIINMTPVRSLLMLLGVNEVSGVRDAPVSALEV